MIGTDEPSATARAHVEALIYGSGVITCDLLMCTLPCAFANTRLNTHAGARTSSSPSPVMDDGGAFPRN